MSISLVGIVWVQAYWIHNGILVKEAQFNQLVNDALNNVVAALEDEEAVGFIHDHLTKGGTHVVVETDSTHQKKVIKRWTSKGDRPKKDTVNVENSFSFDFSSDEGEEGKMEMKIRVNGKSQTIDITNKIENVETILEKDSLLFTDEEDFVFSNRFGEVMVKMVKEFKEIDNPIHHLLKETDIEKSIHANLEDNGIFIPFTYAVLHHDSILPSFSSAGFTGSKNTYRVNLFKNNIINTPAFLAISFNGKSHYILNSMWLMLVCSFLFTLIILLTFASTVYFLFKQKKLADIKNDFINNMTHEFKTPISTISLAIDSITHPQIIENKDKINYYAEIIRKENKRMNTQVESVLNTSLAEKNELSLHKEPIVLHAFKEKVVERMKLQIEAANTVFNSDKVDHNLTLNADEQHLLNAVCNLIDNAIKYAQETPEISFNIVKKETGIAFIVSDKGIGMNKETQKRVFDKFYRVQSGNIHKVKGFGIGLSYVKAIVDAHGGEINLVSKVGEGTRVTITIPQ